MNSCQKLLFIALAPLVSMLGGCTQYGYELVRPAEYSRHVDEKHDAWFTQSPIEYQLLAYENHLVLRIYNRAADPIRLLGDQSVVVDPGRESHPLRAQTISPGTFIKLVLPPLRPEAQPTGPTISFGLGGGFGGRGGRGFYDPYWGGYYDGAPGYTIYDGSNFYWNWTGETDVLLRLTFQRGSDKPFSHEFLFHRRKLN